MIKVTVTRPGTLINKPVVNTLLLEEDKLAMEHRDEETGKLIKAYTVGDLYNLYKTNSSYVPEGTDPETHPKGAFFELWVQAKYLKNVTNILSIEYTRIDG